MVGGSGDQAVTRHRTAKPGDDYYRTPEGTAWHGAAIAFYAAGVGLGEDPRIVDAFAGDGVLMDACDNVGLCPVGFDLHPRRKDIAKLDVADLGNWQGVNGIRTAICNPAYTHWREHVSLLLDTFHKVVALGPCTLLDSKRQLPPGLVEVHFTPRPRFTGDQHPIPHAWLVFKNGHFGAARMTVPPLETRSVINQLNKEARKA